MATPTDLLTGLAERLDAAGHGTWSEQGIWTPGQTAITHKLMPTAPDRVIALTAYGPTDDLVGGRIQRIQVRTRAPGRPTDVDDLDEAIYQDLHGLADVVIGGVHVVSLERISQASLGRDADDRWGLSSNYAAQIGAPTAHTD
ncbi:minor capsid protein [Serinicoccus sediminis]|uniref:minor capsid protein n=1 Tax=Serinicoccus sediminis TaxID=2306021 RepID=UPI001020D6FA|nr:minor capsid protein [Serinicoccus sediminis]